MDDRSGYRALRALVVLEWTRVVPTVLRSLAMGGVVTAVLGGTGAFTLPRMAFILGVVGVVPVLSFPLNALRDKLDGGLEFLRVLPVAARTQALGRLVAIVGMALPASLVATLATVLALKGSVSAVLGLGALLQLFFALTLVMVGVAFLGTALVLRFDVQQSNYALVGVFATFMVLDHVFPDPVGTFLVLSQQGWFPPVLWAVVCVGVLAMAWLGFSMACSGIEGFTPSRDRLTW